MRNPILIILAAASLTLAAGAGHAGAATPRPHTTQQAGLKHADAAIHLAGGKHCPPGLAKKHNGCNPPGLVKHRYRVGDYIHDDYIVIRRPGRYGLDPGESYYRVGDYVYRVDRDTRKVLDLIGAVTAVLVD